MLPARSVVRRPETPYAGGPQAEGDHDHEGYRNEIGPAARAAFSGTRVSWSNTIGMTLTEISMITVPVTVVVNSRRSSSNRAERRNWNSEEAITSLARRTGPPALRPRC